MRRAVRFGPEASSELADASRWYEDRRPGLGSMFLEAVEATVQSVASWPASGTRVEGLADALDVRRAPVSRYPYHLAYLVADDEIHVLAVAHDHRRPTYWTGRA
ncbi:MAG: type II toxin-antitoxin system RelE/ParE family toxin [Actinomycetota bacterium]|nr:type II toxin-antitoxin system RelE/ParE family toxin [Actinomycetota bacterium]